MSSDSSSNFRVGFADGVMPDKWKRIWAERNRRTLRLVPLTERDQERAIRDGDVAMALVRGDIDRDGMHLIPLYSEQPVVIASTEHPAAAYDAIDVAELADDIDVLATNPGISLEDAVATVAAGTGHLVVPAGVARVHQRKDVVSIPVLGVAETKVGLAWLIDNEDEGVQRFIGIVRGRSANSSRS